MCMTFSRKKDEASPSYTVNKKVLKIVSEYRYLGVFFTPTLCWHRHVDYAIAKACRSLWFLRRNTREFPQSTRELLYKSCVRSILDYASSVWDPPTALDKDKLEKVQNMGARYVLGNIVKSHNFSMTRCKQTLGWEQLVTRRAKQRLKLFHDVYLSRTCIPRDSYIFPPHYVSGRVDHMYKVREYRCKTAAFSNSFFPKTVSQWNRLPSAIVVAVGSDSFFPLLESSELFS